MLAATPNHLKLKLAKSRTIFSPQWVANSNANTKPILRELEGKINADPTDSESMLSHAETNVVLFIFGLSSRKATIPESHKYLAMAREIDSTSCKFHTVDGMLKFLDWKWEETGDAFQAAIKADPTDPLCRHWYSLWISTMTGDYTEPMAQSDTIMTLDPSGDFKVGRGSLLYFARRNEELKELMLETIADDPSIPWGYDWLGMAYCELEDWDNSIETYFKAFELSDGLVEVGGGLGHALGLGGRIQTWQTDCRLLLCGSHRTLLTASSKSIHPYRHWRTRRGYPTTA